MGTWKFKSLIFATGLVGAALGSAAQAGAEPVREDLSGTPAASAEVDGGMGEDIIQPNEYQSTAMPSDSRGPNMSAAPQTKATGGG